MDKTKDEAGLMDDKAEELLHVVEQWFHSLGGEGYRKTSQGILMGQKF